MEHVPSLSLPEGEVSSHNNPVETAVSARKHVLVSESVTKISDVAKGKMFPLKNLQTLPYIQEAPRQPET